MKRTYQPDPRPVSSRRTRKRTDEALAWKNAVTANGCAVHDNPADCEPPVQACHVISQQTLRNHGHQDKLWDVRNGIGACYRAHRRSDLGIQRFPVGKLPPAVWEFAGELGLLWVLEGLYGRRAA